MIYKVKFQYAQFLEPIRSMVNGNSICLYSSDSKTMRSSLGWHNYGCALSPKNDRSSIETTPVSKAKGAITSNPDIDTPGYVI